MVKLIKWRTKVRTADKQIVPAVLWGEKGGDLYFGKILYNNRIYELGGTSNFLPRRAVPINPTTKRTPFVDFKANKNRSKRRKRRR